MTARLVVLASGGGRTLENLHQEIQAGRLPATISGVILSRPGLGAAERAARLGLACEVIARADQPDQANWEAQLLDQLDAWKPDLVLLAGWLQLLPIPSRYEGKVLNIHPALLPSYGGRGYYGERVHQAVARDGRRLSGCTVHFATAAYDEGPVVLQQAVPLPPQATPKQIAAQVFAAECQAYPAAIRAVLAGQARWDAGQVRWT